MSYDTKAIILIIAMMLRVTQAQDLLETTFEYPIDIVYLWVDGADPEWQTIKNEYWHSLTKRNQSDSDAHTNNRFADHQELRYSLRSIWRYALFVNHIYIVTMNQRPSWLADHPLISIVDHKEIFKNPADLPTFNSQAIESNLHRIPGLSEYFIYFNDDVFLGGPVSPLDFFSPQGHLRVLFEKSLSPSGPPIENETMYRLAWRNTNAFLDQQFCIERRYRLCHAPFALRKSLIQAIEEQVPHIFESNSASRFRSKTDYNMTNGLFQYWLLYHRLVEPGTLSNMMLSLRSDDHLETNIESFNTLNNKNPTTFCIQDVMGDNNKESEQLLEEFFNQRYSEAAPWEKP